MVTVLPVGSLPKTPSGKMKRAAAARLLRAAPAAQTDSGANPGLPERADPAEPGGDQETAGAVRPS